MTANPDRVLVERYLDKLRNPIDRQPLRLQKDARREGTGRN